MERMELRPSLDEILNLHDFEVRSVLFHDIYFSPISFSRLRKQSCQKKPGPTIAQQLMMRLPFAKITLLTTGVFRVLESNMACSSFFKDMGTSMRFQVTLLTVCQFRPRVLRDVSTVDFSSTILGHKTSMPIYIVLLRSESMAQSTLIIHSRLQLPSGS